jgi:hypothetical protein
MRNPNHAAVRFAGESEQVRSLRPMKAITKFLAAGAAIAAFASAAPAAAQYMPGYGTPYGYGSPYGGQYGNPYGGQYGSPYGYGAVNNQVVVGQCANAVQARLNGGGYGGGYGAYGNGGYGYNGAYGGGRVLGISRVEQRRDGGFDVRGVATSGYTTYGYAPNSPNLTWRCRTDFRGAIVDIDVYQAQRNYGAYDQNDDYTPWTEDYSQYGYQRY